MKSLEYLLWCGRITDRDTSILNWVFFSRCFINTIRHDRIVGYSGIPTGKSVTWWLRYFLAKNHS